MNTTAIKPTLDQERAGHAMQMIQSIDRRDHDGMYVSYVSALPATIVMNGIGQALAAELAKDKGKKKSHRHLFDHVTAWLTQTGRPLGAVEKADDPQSVFHALAESQEVYVAAQIEAMAYIHWLKQFSRAFLVDRAFDEEATNDE